MCKNIDEKKFYIPGKSYVSKLRGALDAGYMCCFHDKLKASLKDGCVIFPMIDSSPQGGRNNELGYTSIVKKSDCANLFHSMLTMSARIVVTQHMHTHAYVVVFRREITCADSTSARGII